MNAVPRLSDASTSLLLVIDLQERLLPRIHESERVVARSVRMIEGARLLGIPILATEQYPKGIGPTVEPVRSLLEGVPTFAKTSFGALGDAAVAQAVEDIGPRTLMLVGIEAHVCITQTALQGLDGGMDVHVVTDAVSSRSPSDLAVGLQRMAAAGATPVTSEMALYEWLRDAASPCFKDVLKLVK